MELFEINASKGWTADMDIDEFEARFGEHDNVQQHVLDRIESAYEEQLTVLITALRYYLDQTSSPLRVAVEALTIPELCGFIFKCVGVSGREPEYVERFRTHLDAIQHYHRQREVVMARHWDSPDHAWLIELADVADALATASAEFDEAMCCEHHDYQSAIV